MSLAHPFAAEPSQAETNLTHRPPAASQRPPELPPAERGRERRGPMRPAALTPARSRLTGWMLGVIFRLADAAALAAVALGAALAIGAATPAAFVPFAVGALALAWGLSVIGAYQFPAKETLS